MCHPGEQKDSGIYSKDKSFIQHYSNASRELAILLDEDVKIILNSRLLKAIS